jgi:hypothetical protein
MKYMISMGNSTISYKQQQQHQKVENYYRLFHEESRKKILSLVNESTIMYWDTRDEPEFSIFEELFDYDKVNYNSTSIQSQKIWTDETRHLVVAFHDFYGASYGLCEVSKQFKKTGCVKKHVLIAHMNENWGALSTYVKGRTANWGVLEKNWAGKGCNTRDIVEYLDNDNTKAVFTVQHQAFDHPKVNVIPLGLYPHLGAKARILKLMRMTPLNKTQLLMVNSRAYETRIRQIQAVLKTSNGTVKNTFGQEWDDYYDEMRRSKFIMCPSGLNWDTYRMWEAFYLSTIPVVEKYSRTDGWFRTVDDLPIVWVDTFEQDLTPAFLESEYEKITMNYRRYNFEKLTMPYWKWFVESFLPK